jgi:hypothetical protein
MVLAVQVVAELVVLKLALTELLTPVEVAVAQGRPITLPLALVALASSS